MKSITRDGFSIKLNDWICVAEERLHADNVHYEECVGINSLTRVIDVQLWSLWKKEMSFPLTFWDAVKIKLFPFWLISKFPARVKRYSFAEVLPSLSKHSDICEKQMSQKGLYEIESISRKPTENFEEWPSFLER